ncbi:MFS transporter [Lactococcus lactis]|nr:MFS transporter [Lactococcus lactis]
MALGSFLLGSIICIFSINFPMLLLGRLFQGISTGIGTPLLFNVILERIPHKVIGLWMGIGSLIISIAPSIGPSYGGLLVSTAGWRWIFIGLLTLPIIALFIGNRNLSNSIRIKNIVKLDLVAFILLSTTLTSFILGINSIAKGNINIVLLIVFLLALGMYIWRSLTSSKTFLNIRVFSNSFFSFSLLFFGIYQFSNLAVNFIIPIFLENSKGTGSLLAGFSMLPGTLIGALF